MVTVKKEQQGFTLIELMIVIAIVGILATIALPAYQDYLIRSRMSEPLATMGESKTSIAEYFASRNALPLNNLQAGLKTEHPSKPFLNTLIYDGTSGQAVVTAYISSGPDGALPTSQAANNQVSLVGTINVTDNEILWVCTNENMKSAYLPATCR